MQTASDFCWIPRKELLAPLAPAIAKVNEP
jgi:hypothetical protein